MPQTFFARYIWLHVSLQPAHPRPESFGLFLWYTKAVGWAVNSSKTIIREGLLLKCFPFIYSTTALLRERIRVIYFFNAYKISLVISSLFPLVQKGELTQAFIIIYYHTIIIIFSSINHFNNEDRIFKLKWRFQCVWKRFEKKKILCLLSADSAMYEYS